MTDQELDDVTLGGRVLRLESGMSDLKYQVRGIGEMLAKLDTKFDAVQVHRRPNISAISAAAAVVVTVIITSGGVAWTIINSNITSAIRQPTDDITHLTDSLRALGDSYSKQWERLNKMDATIADGQSERRAAQAGLEQREAEFETQFRANDAISNLNRMWQDRVNALMWEKLNPGSRWPDNSFFPEIGQTGSQGLSPREATP